MLRALPRPVAGRSARLALFGAIVTAAAPGANALTWDHGKLSETLPPDASGNYVIAAGGQSFRIAGSGQRDVDVSFTNNGYMDWTFGPILARANTVITNNGTWYALTNNSISSGSTDYPGAPYYSQMAKVINNGLFSDFSGQSRITIKTQFTNNGTIDAKGGTFIFDAAYGLNFNSGSRFLGSGSVSIQSVATFSGNIYSESLQLNSGVGINRGVVTGDNATLSGQIELVSGTLAGVWKIVGDATLSVLSTAGKIISGAVTNDGMIHVNGALGLADSGTLVNNGTIDLNATITLGGNGKLTNNGTIRSDKTLSGNTGFGAGSGILVNGARGTIIADRAMQIASTLRNEGGTLDGRSNNLFIVGSNAQFLNGSTFLGGGQFGTGVFVDNGGSFAGSIESAGYGLVFSGGTFTGNAALLKGASRWLGGTMTGTWTVADRLQINDGTVASARAATITNTGTITIGAGDLVLTDGSMLANRQSIELADGARIIGSGDAPGTFTNTGIIQKLAGNGFATIGNGVGFTNQGTIELRNGTLVLPDNFVNGGRLTGTGTLGLTGALTNNGVITPGGTAVGTLTIDGNYVQTALGRLNLQLSTGTLSDLLSVTGSATLDGGLALSCLSCSLKIGDTFKLLTVSSGYSGSFSSLDLNGLFLPADFVLALNYDRTGGAVYAEVKQRVAAVPEPSTWAMMIGGMGIVGAAIRRRKAAVATA